MKTITVDGEEGLGDFLLGIGINQRIVNSVFENVRNEGQTSILNVILPSQMVRDLGLQAPARNAKEKIEAAIDMLKKQGHAIQAVIRENGTMWFEIDSKMLASWEEMINLADGVYTLETLTQIYKVRQRREGQVIPVRFTVFFEAGGPILAYASAGPFESATFASKAGTKYPDVNSLIHALDKVGLPGLEIVQMRRPTKIYMVTGERLSELMGKLPEELNLP